MTRKKFIAPEPQPIYKEVCIQLGTNNDIKDHEHWIGAIYDSQYVWPDFVKEIFRYSYDYKEYQDYGRIHKFLEGCGGAILYHRCWNGFSWIVLDEAAYACSCNELNISKDFILVEENPRSFELVRRKISPAAEAPSTPAEPDNKPVAT